MNCEKAKKTSLASILANIGAVKKKTTKREIWYLSPFSDEKNASFKIDIIKNIWFDFGTLGKGGNVLDFLMLYYKCDLKDALSILDNNYESFSFHKPTSLKMASQKEKKHKIKHVQSISNKNLVSYLKSRSISFEIAQQYCVEVHYSVNDKDYYGIGFKNNLGGYEIRNQYFKGCLGIKAITIINKQFDTVSLFESWSDFLSYLTLKKNVIEEDFLILNSTNQVENAISELKKYKVIKAFLDNDPSGDKAMKLIEENIQIKLLDYRKHYQKHNDLNEYLVEFKRKQ